jgi:alpha-tubulin suppressor-like RCC1 family protein
MPFFIPLARDEEIPRGLLGSSRRLRSRAPRGGSFDRKLGFPSAGFLLPAGTPGKHGRSIAGMNGSTIAIIPAESRRIGRARFGTADGERGQENRVRRILSSIAFLSAAVALAGCNPKTTRIPAYHTPLPGTASPVSTTTLAAGHPSAESAAPVPSHTMEINASESAPAVAAQPIAAGKYHTCAVADDGGIRCWGNNRYGQLGNGMTGEKSLLVETAGFSGRAAAVAAGDFHTCALDETGNVLCWGHNQFGQLGDGTATNRSVPVPVKGLDGKTVMIAAGSFFSCALSELGEVECWGWNGNGQLGDGTEIDRSLPVRVQGLAGPIVSIAAGEEHVCALSASGGVRCWGRGSEGQLGDGRRSNSEAPVDAVGLQKDVAGIAAGGGYSCALLRSGSVFCWGRHGSNGGPYDSAVPAEIAEVRGKLASVDVGELFACGITVEGGVLCWGINNYGQLGNGTETEGTDTPVAVSGLSAGAEFLSSGVKHSCVRMQSGEVKCWGGNEFWQLGGSASLSAPAPVAVDLSIVHYYYSGIEAAAPPAGYPQKYPSIWNLTDGFHDLQEPGVNTYAATMTRGKIFRWDFYLCATDKARLEGLLAVTQVKFLIDYLPVSEKAMLIFRSNYNSWACQGWTTSLSQWEHDGYELGIVYTFEENVSDGALSYPAGEYWQILMLKVED